ncbi:MAG: extracellular catalytic domain type 2 short-chain-length polyhydroxyalkanoate depolymerase [Micromonosporaceae bacterium]
MRRFAVAALAALALTTPTTASAEAATVTALPRYTISGVYAAGISSGGYAATQLHVAYSGTFRGAAVFAGGPYYCAQRDVFRAQYACMKDWWDDQLPQLKTITRSWSGQGLIDPVGNLSGDPVYVFHGTNDSTVVGSVSGDLVTYYRDFGANVVYQSSTPAGHAWISPKGPNPCGSTYPPYINNCGIDPEGSFLRHLLGSANPPNTGARQGTLTRFDQNPYAVGGSASALSLGTDGFVYAPTSCANGAACRLVVVLHGCNQGYSTIGTRLIDTAYLNEYADTNNLVVLYPQAKATSGSNPQGCWDWWGYLGEADYARHGGAQLDTVLRMVHALGG